MAEIINLSFRRALRDFEASVAQVKGDYGAAQVAEARRRATGFRFAHQCIYCAGMGVRETWQGSGQIEDCTECRGEDR